eukprot:Rhum_TRINITY_DN14763_c10_g1::Rhum_TRINITY_DN14763_c10_g1_i1::g.110930::m.110930
MNTEPVFSTVTASVDDYRSPARRSLLSSSSAVDPPPPPPHTHNHSYPQPVATSSVAAAATAATASVSAHDTSATTTRILEFKAESEQLRKVYELRERQLKSQLGLETQKMEVDLRVARESLEAERAKRIDAAAAASRDAEELRREAARVQAQADERLRTVRAQHAEEVAALTREMRAVHAAAAAATTAAPTAAATAADELKQEAVRQASALLHKQSVYIQNLESKLEEVEARACAEQERAAKGEDVADARRTGVLEARVVSLAAQLEAREEEMAQLRRSKDLEIEQLDRMLKQEAARAAKAVKEQIDAVRDVERATGGEVAELQALVKDLLGQQKQRETLCDALKAQLAKKEQELAAAVVHPFQQQQQHNGTNLFAVSPSSVGVSPPSAGESVRRAAAAAAAALSPAPLPAPALHALEATTSAEGAAQAQAHAQQAEEDAAAGRPQEAVRDAYQSLWHEERMRLERVVREKTAENEQMRQGLDSMFEHLKLDAETRDEEKRVWQKRVANLEEALITLVEGAAAAAGDDADAAAAQSPSPSSEQQQQPQQPSSATVPKADAPARSPPQQVLEEISGLLDRSPNMSGISFHHPDDSEAPPAQRRSSSASGGGRGAASGRRLSSVGGGGSGGQEASQTFDQDILLRIDQHLHKMLAHREVTEEATLKRELQDKREEVSQLTKKYKSAKGKLAKEVRDREGLSQQVANLSVMLDTHIGESRKAGSREHAPPAGAAASAQRRSASSTRRAAAGGAAARSGSAQPVATLRRQHSPAPAQPRITKTKRCPWHSRG